LHLKPDVQKAVNTINLSNITKFDTVAVANGDLNSDGIPDFVVLLKRVGEDTINPAPTRPLIIFFGQIDQSYIRFCSSDSIAMTHDMGGVSRDDPFAAIKINTGIFSMEHAGGMGTYHWDQTVSFKYSIADKIFYVDKIENDEYKYSDKPRETFGHTTIKTAKEFGMLTFDKYSCFKQYE
jgi:hypothetical protein